MRSLVLVSTVALMLAAQAVVEACGDKFLMVGRGLAFGRAYASIYPGAILIYGQPATNPQTKKLQQTVRKAGHRVVIVSDRADLATRLALQQTDLIIADATVKSAVDTEIAALPTKPSVLYLVSEQEQARTAAVQDEASIIKSGEKPGRFLTVIEDIMKTRQLAGVRVKKG